MSKLHIVSLATFCVSLLVVSTGYAQPDTPQWGAVCEHLGGLMDVEVTEEMCTSMQAGVSEECGDNIAAAMRCVIAANDMAAFEACEAVCEGESRAVASPEWVAVCAHLGGLMDLVVTDDMCLEMQVEVSRECGDNTDAAMRCVLAAADITGFEACQEICEDEPTAVASAEWVALCAHIGEILEFPVTDVMCAEAEADAAEDCGDNVGAAMRCILDADDMASFEACQEVCDE